jgi:hypothetical protein
MASVSTLCWITTQQISAHEVGVTNPEVCGLNLHSPDGAESGLTHLHGRFHCSLAAALYAVPLVLPTR